jgi:hypothetical protein
MDLRIFGAEMGQGEDRDNPYRLSFSVPGVVSGRDSTWQEDFDIQV